MYPPRYSVPSSHQAVKNASNAVSTNLRFPDVGMGSGSPDKSTGAQSAGPLRKYRSESCRCSAVEVFSLRLTHVDTLLTVIVTRI